MGEKEGYVEQTQESVTNSTIELSDSEKALIEAQRQENLKLEAFRVGYQKLVQETGFAWVVDTKSPIEAPKLGITRVK